MARDSICATSFTLLVMFTNPTTRTRPTNVAPLVSAHAIDGSKVHVHYNGISENLHFFTDHAASVILNPNELPFSMASLDYIQLMSESIGWKATGSRFNRGVLCAANRDGVFMDVPSTHGTAPRPSSHQETQQESNW